MRVLMWINVHDVKEYIIIPKFILTISFEFCYKDRGAEGWGTYEYDTTCTFVFFENELFLIIF